MCSAPNSTGNQSTLASFRHRSEELEKAWWSEQAELSSGPAAAGKGAVPEDEVASTQWQVGQHSVHSQLHHAMCP